MRAFPIALIGLALLAGTAGYITHRVSNRVSPQVASPAQAVAADVQTAPLEADEGDPLSWPLATPAGENARLADWPAPVLVVNFWATWCPPCLREIPAFIELQQRYGANGVQFVGIALDKAAAVAPFIAERGVNYPTLIGDQQVVRMMQHFGNDIGGLPYTVVIQNGTVQYTHRGEWEAEDAENRLTSLLMAQ